MDIKKKILLVLGWVLSIVVATTVATNCVAQQLIPPPPVLGSNMADVSQIERRLESMDKKLDRIGKLTQAIKKLSLAIYTKMFPLSMEREAQEFGRDDD